jgi:hypothetical protein
VAVAAEKQRGGHVGAELGVLHGGQGGNRLKLGRLKLTM